MKVLEKGTNKAGRVYALATRPNGAVVYAQCFNYFRGHTDETYRICTANQRQSNSDFQKMARDGMPMAEAKALFNKKLAGKQKA